MGHLKVIDVLDHLFIFWRFHTDIKSLLSQGVSANWWNHRHFQHHAKPNVFSKDPDVNMLHLFVVGATQPVEASSTKLIFLISSNSP